MSSFQGPARMSEFTNSVALSGRFVVSTPRAVQKEQTIRELLPLYLAYAEHEWNLAPKTLACYVGSIRRALNTFGDITPQQMDLSAVLALKTDLARRHVSANWTRNIVNALRSFLRFCRLVLNLVVLDPKAISLPRIPRRDVVFLTPKEIERFLAAIPVFKSNKRLDMRWLGCRALVEVLIGTGMRISETLNMKRMMVNFETGEANIVGKGNKERTVFFTPRACGWLKEYVTHRSDSSEWLFVLPEGTRLTYDTARCWFKELRARAGLEKRVTPHILRHTCATLLLFNGCPIGHIKEILGHDRLETTCRYYLGTDKSAAKEAHKKYLAF